MKKMTRRFVWAENEEYGITGWIPLWIPRSANFTPGDGRGLMHDMLEHSLSDKGSFAEEVVAFGRIVAFRLLSGVMPNYFGRLGAPQGAELYSTWLDAGLPIIEAPPVGRLYDTDANSVIREMVKNFAKSDRGGTYENDGDERNLSQAEYDALYRLLQLGYRSALYYYEGLGRGNCASIGYEADRISRQLDKVKGDTEGDRLDITLYVREAHFEWKVVPMQESYTQAGSFRPDPLWLRRWWNS